MTVYRYIDSPIGTLLLTGDGTVLEELFFPGPAKTFEVPEGWREDHNGFSQVVSQLQDYFSGKRKDFSLQIKPKGTPFQQNVWAALQNIPYGQTASYGDIARNINNPKACRAVGMANKRNPIPIIIPCHRVIGKDGSLTGFGGGLDLKKQLLDLEKGSAGQ